MNFYDDVEQIKDTMKRGGEPLTEDQEALFAGAVVFHLDRVYNEGQKKVIQNASKMLADLLI